MARSGEANGNNRLKPPEATYRFRARQLPLYPANSRRYLWECLSFR
jgi:hypothetical protein